jgi:hypothetical protein
VRINPKLIKERSQVKDRNASNAFYDLIQSMFSLKTHQIDNNFDEDVEEFVLIDEDENHVNISLNDVEEKEMVEEEIIEEEKIEEEEKVEVKEEEEKVEVKEEEEKVEVKEEKEKVEVKEAKTAPKVVEEEEKIDEDKFNEFQYWKI